MPDGGLASGSGRSGGQSPLAECMGGAPARVQGAKPSLGGFGGRSPRWEGGFGGRSSLENKKKLLKRFKKITFLNKF